MNTRDRIRKIRRTVLSVLLLIAALAAVPDVRQMGRRLFLAVMEGAGHRTTEVREHPQELPPYTPSMISDAPALAAVQTSDAAPHQENTEISRNL